VHTRMWLAFVCTLSHHPLLDVAQFTSGNIVWQLCPRQSAGRPDTTRETSIRCLADLLLPHKLFTASLCSREIRIGSTQFSSGVPDSRPPSAHEKLGSRELDSCRAFPHPRSPFAHEKTGSGVLESRWALTTIDLLSTDRSISIAQTRINPRGSLL